MCHSPPAGPHSLPIPLCGTEATFCINRLPLLSDKHLHDFAQSLSAGSAGTHGDRFLHRLQITPVPNVTITRIAEVLEGVES